MSSLLPERHPNKDFFVLDVKDAAPKDDIASMEHPVFSLSIKPDMRELEYRHNGKRMVIVPSGRGLATIMDKDIILYAISKLTHRRNKGLEINQWVEMSAHEVMVACNWNTGARDYKRFEDALIRLRGTTIKTDIPTGETLQTRGFGIIDEFEIERRNENGDSSVFGRLSKVRIKVSDWTFNAIRAGEVLSINPQYFRLRRPLERRIYELARKHVGDQDRPFRIGLSLLQKKVGSGKRALNEEGKAIDEFTPQSLKKFRYFLREIIEDGHIPDYTARLGEDDIVTFAKIERHKAVGSVYLKTQTLERAKAMAVEKGYDFYALQAEWEEFMASKGMPASPDGAFIGFVKKKKSLRQGAFL